MLHTYPGLSFHFQDHLSKRKAVSEEKPNGKYSSFRPRRTLLGDLAWFEEATKNLGFWGRGW
jgi:hypothetical protein